jgi:ankyrin repeat protein
VSADRALWEACQAGDLEAARRLLEAGADPNAAFDNDFGPVSPLFGAVCSSEELTRLLLKHGADPNAEPHFGDALYHSVEAPDPGRTRALLEAGAQPNGSHALAHALDYERPEHIDLLLAYGATPDGRDLVHAVRRGRDLATIELLIEKSADVDARGGEWSTPESRYRTAYSNAYLRNRTDLLEVLAAAGASTALNEGDEAVAAVARGERVELPAELDPDQQEVLAEGALHGHVDLVVELLGVDRVLHNGGGPAGTLLHMAAWVGNAELVERLLELGADPTARPGETGTPLDWARHGRNGDHDRVVALLAA